MRNTFWSTRSPLGLGHLCLFVLVPFLAARRTLASPHGPVASTGNSTLAPGPHAETFQVFGVDYSHVQMPFEIVLWIMLASLAKLGEFIFTVFLIRKTLNHSVEAVFAVTS